MKQKFDLKLIISAAFFIVTICVFGPLEIYVANQGELWFDFFDVLMVSGVMSLAAAVIVGGIGMLLKGKMRSAYSAILFCLTLCLYLQGNYINISYGTLDGRAINWGNYDTYAVLDTAFWVGVIAVLIVLWKKKRILFERIQVYASAFIIAIQVMTLGVLLLTGGIFSAQKNDEYYLSVENLHTVGSEGNIIVFILDAFDEAYIEEIFAAEPEKYQGIFEDFTHYTNVAAGGATTQSALPIIVTGKHYPGEISYKEYVDTAFDTDGLYTQLKKQGYSVNIYTDSVYVSSGADEHVDNIVNGEYRIASPMGFVKKYGSLTLYKYMPHLLKRYFWLYTGDFDAHKKGNNDGYAPYQSDDAEFYRILAEEGLQKRDGKVFTILHTTGSHPPYDLNEFAQKQENVTILQKSKGQLYIVEEYLRQMKELGVYDNSTVMIMSDHGQINLPRGMMMIKKPYAKGFKENDAPVSHFDLHNTFFELLGIEKGESIFDIQENVERTRMYYPQTSTNGSFYMTEYAVLGNPKDQNNVKATGVILAPTMKEHRYKLGETLTFGADGTVNSFVESGLSGTSPGFSWTDSQETVFRIPLEKKPRKDLKLELTYYTVYLEINDQHLGILADDTLLFEEVLTEPDSRTITVDVPKELAKDRELVIKLDLPNAKSPAEVFGTAGSDGRALGIAMTGLCIQ